MANLVIMPKAGQTMEEGTLVAWRKQEGDSVEKGELILEVESEKAVVEVESFYSGVLIKQLASEGDVVPVLMPLAVIAAPGEEVDIGKLVDEYRVQSARDTASARAGRPSEPLAAPIPAGAEVREEVFVRASPAAKRLAKLRGIDYRVIAGTGPGGRIVERDVLAYVEQNAPTTVSEEAKPPTLTPVSKMRRAIAAMMQESAHDIPHFSATLSVEMDAVLEDRERRNANRPDRNKISISDYVSWACARALHEMPGLNSRWTNEGILNAPDVNLGIAVAVEEGILVPAIERADRLSLEDIAVRSKQVMEAALLGRVNDVPGSFTISNLGMHGVESFTAIINPPQAAILAVGAVKKAPVVVGGDAFAVRSVMKMTLSCDHRLVDGVAAARFLNSIKNRLEHFGELLDQ